jgi:cold shock CspA family protein
MQNAKHHEGEKCHRGTCETIRLPDRETGGEYHRVHQSVSLSDHCMPNHAKTVHQELTVKQKDLHFRVEQGDCHHHADNIEVDLELKSFEMRGGKTHVHVGAPKVHFEEQKVTFEVVEGKNHKGHHATGFQAVAKPATKAARKPATKPAALVAKPATKAARKPATKPAAKRGRR